MSDIVAGAVNNIAARTRHLETLEYIARAGAADTADAITDGLIVYDVDYDYQIANWTIAAAGGVWETDPTVLATVTLPAVADLICFGMIRWRSSVLRDTSTKFRCLLDGITAGDTTEYLGEPNAYSFMSATPVNYFAGVAAGVHTVTWQAARNNGGDTVLVSRRNMVIVAIQA